MSEIKVGDKYHNRRYHDEYRFTVRYVGFKDHSEGDPAVVLRNQHGIEFVVLEEQLLGDDSKFAPGWPEEQIKAGDEVTYLEGTGLRSTARVLGVHNGWAWVLFDGYSVSGEIVNLKNLRKKA